MRGSIFVHTLFRYVVAGLVSICWCLDTATAQNVFQLNGSAVLLNGSCIQLTDSIPEQAGGFISFQRLDLNRPFDISFTAVFGDRDEFGADGIAFVLHTDERGKAALGRIGAGIGYGWDRNGTGPVMQRSLTVEFDTFDNDSDGLFGDIEEDHISVIRNGFMPRNLSGPVALENIEDNRCYEIRITWTPSEQRLSVYFDNIRRIDYREDLINDTFQGESTVWWGVTSATGDLVNRHLVRYNENGVSCDCSEPEDRSNILCESACIDFDDPGIPQALEYRWSLPGANPESSTAAAPANVCYDSSGVFAAELAFRTDLGWDTLRQSIVVLPDPYVSAGNDTEVCPGAGVQLSGTIDMDVPFRWSPATDLSDPGVLDPIASPTVATTYYLTAQTARGCEIRDSVTVRMIPPPQAALSDVQICIGGAGVELDPDVEAFGDVEYSWTPTTGLSDPTVRNPIANPASTTEYTLTVTEGTDCRRTAIASTLVTTLPVPEVDAGFDVLSCRNVEVDLRADLLAGNPDDIVYEWSPANGLNVTTGSAVIATPASTTEYTVTAINTVTGCRGSDRVLVEIDDALMLEAPDPAPVCLGESVEVRATGADTYRWSPIEGVSDPTSPNPIITPSSTAVYKVVATLGDCSDSVLVTVTALPLPDVQVPDRIVFCQHESDNVELPVDGRDDFSYSWSPTTGLDNPLAKRPLAQPSTTTTYTLTVTSPEGCQNQFDLTVEALPELVVQAGADAGYCAGSGGVELQAAVSNASNVFWTPEEGLSDPFSVNPIAAPSDDTRYILWVDNGSCFASDTVDVTVFPLPIVTADGGTVICAGEEAELSAVGSPGDFTWTPAASLDDADADAPIATPPYTTDYMVELTDANECSTTASVTVFVEPRNDIIFQLGPVERLYAPGDTARVPLVIDERVPGMLDSANIVAFDLQLRYSMEGLALSANKTLAVVPTTSGWNISADEHTVTRTLRIAAQSLAPEATLQPGTFATLTFVVLLPQSQATETEIEFVPGEIALTLRDTRIDGRCTQAEGSGDAIGLHSYCLSRARPVLFRATGYDLRQSYPNPAIDEAVIEFSIAHPALTTLTLYDVMGRESSALISQHLREGTYQAQLSTAGLAPGAYRYVLTSGPFRQVRTLTVSR